MVKYLNLTCNKCNSTFTLALDYIIKYNGQINCPNCKNKLWSMFLRDYAIAQQNANNQFKWLQNDITRENQLIDGKPWIVEIEE